MTISKKAWACTSCQICNVSQNTFGSLLCMYSYLTGKPGSNPKMWFKEHSPDYRELISYSGKVIAIWRSSQGVWRERTNIDAINDWEEYGNDIGDHFISDEGSAFQLSMIYP